MITKGFAPILGAKPFVITGYGRAAGRGTGVPAGGLPGAMH